MTGAEAQVKVVSEYVMESQNTIKFKGNQWESVPVSLIIKAAKKEFPNLSFNQLEVEIGIAKTYPSSNMLYSEHDYCLILSKILGENTNIYTDGLSRVSEERVMLVSRITLQDVLEKIKVFSLPNNPRLFYLIPSGGRIHLWKWTTKL